MITAVVDTDIPLVDHPPTFEDLRARVDAAFAALAEIGADVFVSDDDIAVAQDVVTGVRKPDDVLLSSPGTIVQIKAILTEYDRAVVESAQQIRTFVTNRLIMETTSPDPRIRIKALELLGKISDVGLFTEKTEITMRHRPTEELEQMLRERLAKVIEADTALPDTAKAQTPASLDDVTDVL